MGLQTIEFTDTFSHIWLERTTSDSLSGYFNALADRDYIIDWSTVEVEITTDGAYYYKNHKLIDLKCVLVGDRIVSRFAADLDSVDFAEELN